MNSGNFLSNIYLGRRPLDNLPTFEEAPVDKRVAEIIRRYLEMTAAHPDTDNGDIEENRKQMIQRLKKSGFFGLTIPKQYGGMGLRLRQYLKIVEQTMASGMAIGFTALAHLSIGVKGIVLFGTEEQKRKYLVPAASGDIIFSYALTEPNTGSDARSIETTASLSDDGRHYILNGSKTYITNANLAGAMTVFAQIGEDKPGHMGAFIVETTWDGVRVGQEMPKMGLKASSTAAVRFKNVKVPVENLLGQPGDGFKIAMTVLNYGRLALGAGSAGMMKQSLHDMRNRSMRRTQFGAPISDFELIQEKWIHAAVNGEVASAMTEFAAAMLEKHPLASFAVESSHCKLFGTTRAWDTLYDALQVAGGSGYLTTQPYEKRMRDFRVTTIFEGTTEIHSIYPALFILRKFTKHLQAKNRGRLLQILQILKDLLLPPRWNLRFRHSAMNRALRFARFNATMLRWMLAAGLLLYGRQVSKKQFYLRRVTHLSLYLFGTIALLSKIEAARREGRDVDDKLHLLNYFVSEGKKARHSDGYRFFYRKRLHENIIADLRDGSAESADRHSENGLSTVALSSAK